MSVQEVRLADLAQQLAGLVVLASCAAVTARQPKPEVNVLPAVAPGKPVPQEPKQGVVSPEVLEFMTLPQHLQRQVLDYARNWIDANFEKL